MYNKNNNKNFFIIFKFKYRIYIIAKKTLNSKNKVEIRWFIGRKKIKKHKPRSLTSNQLFLLMCFNFNKKFVILFNLSTRKFNSIQIIY